MKKIIKLIPFLLLFLLIACEQGIIFHDIALEIELEEPNILGNVNSIVKLNGMLYTQNGNIYNKGLTQERGWTKMSAPGRVTALASNATHLYALTAEQTDDEGEAHAYTVWASVDGTGNWTKVTGAASVNTIVLFDNGVLGDADDSTDRKAYVRIEGEVKELIGTVMGSAITTHGADSSTVAAARSNGNDYFSNTRAFCSTGTKLYSVINDVIHSSSTNTAEAPTWDDLEVSITDATVMVYADDKLYIGTSLGLEQVSLDASGDPSQATNLPSNAEATTGEKEISALGYFSSFGNNAIYAGATERYSLIGNGLWGYYPSRGNWNFE